MVNLPCPVALQARARPEAVALVAGERRWSWAELDAAVSRSAGRLRADGIGPGDRLALLAGNHPAVIHLFFALRRLGAVDSVSRERARRIELAWRHGGGARW